MFAMSWYALAEDLPPGTLQRDMVVSVAGPLLFSTQLSSSLGLLTLTDAREGRVCGMDMYIAHLPHFPSFFVFSVGPICNQSLIMRFGIACMQKTCSRYRGFNLPYSSDFTNQLYGYIYILRFSFLMRLPFRKLRSSFEHGHTHLFHSTPVDITYQLPVPVRS